MRKRTSQSGVTVMLVLAFLGIFGLILGTVTSYALMQSKYGRALYAREQALHIAEAGLEYYRWFLAHNPAILQTGVGLVSPYTYTVEDPEGGELGNAEVTATANSQCDAVQWIDLASEGVPNADTRFPRTLSVRYMLPSVAEYSYLLNSNVWAGSDRNIRGPYHSNGGIRMDATHNSDVMSAVATWNCDGNYNCSPSQPNAPGVVGDGSNPALWTYPVPNVNFEAIGVNFTDLQSRAENNGGIHYDPASGSVNNRGYHLIFNADGTVTVYRVTSTIGKPSYSSQYGWGTEYSIINNETLLGTYAVPSSCSLIFVEDRVWLEGTVGSKVAVVAATPDDSGTSPDVYLRNNIVYASNDGSDGLTVIAERNVLIPLTSPDFMEIHGIFVAQSGHYGRDFFTNSSSYPPSLRVGQAYSSYVLQSELTTVGTVVSNGRTGTAWSSGGSTISGYQQRYDYYDQLLAFSPPPFTPTVSTDYRFALWREQ
ncbi:hypothetical protein C4556_01230 [Candidatus Parcubacteria bacterium]|nr:MAG: hypothetical protein C4556_01230 [Candidatus Parcubacteria bacterium]